jgi:hypothetical protein
MADSQYEKDGWRAIRESAPGGTLRSWSKEFEKIVLSTADAWWEYAVWAIPANSMTLRLIR